MNHVCLIAYAPSGKGTIPAAVIAAATVRHPDGFGVMFRDASGLHTETWAPSDKPAFLKRLDALNTVGTELAVHFRFATSGPKDASMSHPYTYEDPDPAVGTVGIVHNGIIGIKHDRNVESDTNAFVRLVLAYLPSRWWDEPALVYLVGEAIGWSKFVIMTATETVNLHEQTGEWDGGVWYSSAHRPFLASPKWTPTTHKAQQAPNPASKRSQKRAAAATRKAANKPVVSLVPALVTPDTAYIPEVGMRGGGYPGLRHNGHALSATTPINRDKDGDYPMGAICDECHTFFDVYVIEGMVYMEGGHHFPAPVEQRVAVCA